MVDSSKVYKDYNNLIADIKFEAIKEFVERLKDKSLTKWDYHEAVDIEEIDNLVKEIEKQRGR